MKPVTKRLPKSVMWRYRIVASELVADNLILFKNRDGKWGVLKRRQFAKRFTLYSLLLKPKYNSIAFHSHRQLFTAAVYKNGKSSRNGNTCYFFDVPGELQWKTPPGWDARIDTFGNLIINSNGRFGLLGDEFEMLIEPAYDYMRSLSFSHLKVGRHKHFGITDRTGNLLLDVTFTNIFEQELHDAVIVMTDGNYYRFDIRNRKLEKLDVDFILPASSNSYGAPNSLHRGIYKSILNCTEDKWQQTEMRRYCGKWGIIAADGSVQLPNVYDYVDCLRTNGFFKVCMGSIRENTDPPECEDIRTYVHNGKWGVVDAENRIIVPIRFDWVDEIGDGLFAVYQGGDVYFNGEWQEEYWTIAGGKLGVYCRANLIVPIEYDSIHTSWFRVKNYIFVQKGRRFFNESDPDYDVYTFDGDQVIENKPEPKNHRHTG